MNPQDLRVIKSKQNMMDALMKLLKEKNFSEITVSEICKESKINRSTFYTHYANTDELFGEKFNRLLSELTQEYQAIIQMLYSIDLQAMVPLYQHILKHKEFYTILLSDNAPSKYVKQFHLAFTELPKEVILKSIDESYDVELYYAFCIGATLGIIHHWQKTGYQRSPEEMSTYTVKFFHAKR